MSSIADRIYLFQFSTHLWQGTANLALASAQPQLSDQVVDVWVVFVELDIVFLGVSLHDGRYAIQDFIHFVD